MHKALFTFILFTLLPNVASSQPTARKIFKGKVSADVDVRGLDGVYVINLNTEEAASTQSGGYFSLALRVGDTLMLSSIQLKGTRYVINEDDLVKPILLIRMEPIMHQLREVIVYSYKNINAEDLGIIPRGRRSYTAAERKLKTATSLNAMSGAVTIDPLFNFLSGRTAMLKKELVVERKESLLNKIDNMFEKEYFTEKLKIPAEYVRGFQYYLVENDRFAATVNTKNKTLATFMMGELAVQYLDIIAGEKK
jgi:hypothetical protein